jgi:hypothetical protein
MKRADWSLRTLLTVIMKLLTLRDKPTLRNSKGNLLSFSKVDSVKLKKLHLNHSGPNLSRTGLGELFN